MSDPIQSRTEEVINSRQNRKDGKSEPLKSGTDNKNEPKRARVLLMKILSFFSREVSARKAALSFFDATSLKLQRFIFIPNQLLARLPSA